MPRAVSIRQVPGKPGQVYYPLSLDEVAQPTPGPTELLVKITAAALNHRDLFIRQHLYPGTGFGVPLLADGCGVVVAAGASADKSWEGKRVILNPGTGWRDNPDGPEESLGGYRILGGTRLNPIGTLQEYVAIDQSEVEEAPAHLSDAEAAALPLTGLTAWRALVTKAGPANVAPGKKLLITGIGGGVALMALAFATAHGADVWVTSGGPDKIDRAVALGAKGGVSYREDGWEKKLLAAINAGSGGRSTIDAIIDGAGGDIVEKGTRILKLGGVISCYGMTVGPKMPFLMQTVLKNIELKGSTMGSRKEFKDMVDFVKEKGIQPVVSRVVHGIDNIDGIDGLFEDMKAGKQFGKLVIEIGGASDGKRPSKI